jgi:predicted RNase H-like HicB family nuclease
MATTVYTALIAKDGDMYAALCPELDVASQGATVEEATSNLREAVELFLEHEPPFHSRREVFEFTSDPRIGSAEEGDEFRVREISREPQAGITTSRTDAAE